MCDKAIDTGPFVFDSVPDQYKIQQKIVFKEPVMLKYCHDRYKTQEMCDKAVDAYLPSPKFRPDWFVTNKVFET